MKGLVRLISVAMVSSFLFAAFSAQAQNNVKFQILQIQEDIQQNQDNPNFDMNAAQQRLSQLKTTYKPEERVASEKVNSPSSAHTYSVDNSGSSSEVYTSKKEAYIAENEELIKEVRKLRDAAIKAGTPTEKYDKYIQEYEETLQKLENLENK